MSRDSDSHTGSPLKGRERPTARAVVLLLFLGAAAVAGIAFVMKSRGYGMFRGAAMAPCAERLERIGALALAHFERTGRYPPPGPGHYEASGESALLRCPATDAPYEFLDVQITDDAVKLHGMDIPVAWDAQGNHGGWRNVLDAKGRISQMEDHVFEGLPQSGRKHALDGFEDWSRHENRKGIDRCHERLESAGKAIRAFRESRGRYPPPGEGLFTALPDAEIGTCPVSGARYECLDIELSDDLVARTSGQVPILWDRPGVHRDTVLILFVDGLLGESTEENLQETMRVFREAASNPR